MSIKIPSLMVFILLLLTACNSKTMTFSGETKNWSAVFKVVQNEEGFENEEIELQYKGYDVNSVGELTYEVETNAGGFGVSKITLKDNGTLKGSSESNPTNAKVIENSKVKVTINWNGKTETVILTND